MIKGYSATVLDASPVPRETVWSGARTLVPSWHRLTLGAILLLAALLNFWRLDSLGYANSYYAAAVKSMLQSWHNFFFVSLDPGGFVSIDKPPLGFWIQTASAKLFGYSGTSILLPEALAGVASVAVLYRLVGRIWGTAAGLLAALFLALTPVSVVTSRNNTIDSLLVLTVLLAAWAVSRAAETGRLRWLMVGAVLIGLGFNIKMLEAYLVVPSFGLLYLLGAKAGWRKRIAHLAAAGVAMLAVSLSWALAVDLTPASARPYVGSSGTNSALNLALGYNGLSRLTGGSGTPGGGGGGGGNGVNLFNGGPAGVFRLIGTTLGGQVSWLLVLAVLGLAGAALTVPWRRLDDSGRSLILWGVWLGVAGAFFSVAEFFHPYYTVMLAPAIAALSAIGVTALWRAYRSGSRLGWLLPVVLLAGAIGEAHILQDYPDWSRWLDPLIVGTGVVAALALVAARLVPHRVTFAPLLALSICIVSMLVAPAAWSAYSVAHGTSAGIPTAGPSAQGSGGGNGGPGGFGGPGGSAGANGFGNPPAGGNGAPPSGSTTGGTTASGMRVSGGLSVSSGPGLLSGNGGAPGASGGGPGGMGGGISSAMLKYLEAHQGMSLYLVATASSQNASSIIINTGKAVMALGGFSGNDTILTARQLASLVKSGAVHYFLLDSGGMGRGSDGGNSALTQWVQAHGTVVPASQYATSTAATSADFGGAATLYYVSSSAAGK